MCPLPRIPLSATMRSLQIVNHGAIHYTMGMRGYYLAIPLTLWLFGPVWLLGGSITLILILNKLDRTA